MGISNSPYRWLTAPWDGRVPVLPNVPGVYAIYVFGDLRYIGCAEDIRHRVTQGHKLRRATRGGDFFTPWGTATTCTVKFRQCKRAGEWLMIEYRMIERLRPLNNKRMSMTAAQLKADETPPTLPAPVQGVVYEDGTGANIPGSRYLRAFCAECREPLRVSKVEDEQGIRINHYCELHGR